jgi:hypothetical protein
MLRSTSVPSRGGNKILANLGLQNILITLYNDLEFYFF